MHEGMCQEHTKQSPTRTDPTDKTREAIKTYFGEGRQGNGSTKQTAVSFWRENILCLPETCPLCKCDIDQMT